MERGKAKGSGAYQMSAALPSYSSLLSTSGDIYSGVPQAVLQTEPLSSSLLYPKSHSLMMGSGMLPSSSTLSSCAEAGAHCQGQAFKREHYQCTRRIPYQYEPSHCTESSSAVVIEGLRRATSAQQAGTLAAVTLHRTYSRRRGTLISRLAMPSRWQ